jgi:hypothetical protein
MDGRQHAASLGSSPSRFIAAEPPICGPRPEPRRVTQLLGRPEIEVLRFRARGLAEFPQRID